MAVYGSNQLLTSLIAWFMILVCSKSLEAKFRENTSIKLTYLLKTFVKVFLAIKSAI